MAIFLPSPLVGGISGDVGAVNFVNKSGSVVARRKRRPSRLAADAIGTSQARLATAAAAWKELTENQQDAWNWFARQTPSPNRLGTPTTTSGYNQFVKQRLYSALAGETPLDVPVTGITGTSLFNFSLFANLTVNIGITFEDSDPGPTKFAFIYGRNLYRDTITSQNNAWTFIDFVSTTGLSWILTSKWDEVLGLPQLNQVIAAKIVISQKTVPLPLPAIALQTKTIAT